MSKIGHLLVHNFRANFALKRGVVLVILHLVSSADHFNKVLFTETRSYYSEFI